MIFGNLSISSTKATKFTLKVSAVTIILEITDASKIIDRGTYAVVR